MIFYFSGTGNSLYAAKKIGSYLKEDVISISSAMHNETELRYELKENETIGFVFPLYAFSAPKMVFDFLSKMELGNFHDNYIFAVATYGQNIGRFDKFFDVELEKKGMHLSAGFSLNMPNNYFHIWSEEEQKKCLDAAEITISRISQMVSLREKIFEITITPNAEEIGAKMNKQYNSTLNDTSAFYANDQCVNCGLCAKVCNGQCIKLIDGKPTWGEGCTKCFACIHLCPQRAIQYKEESGNYHLSTENAGRYKNPNINIQELTHR